MWQITDKYGQVYKIGTESTTLEQAIAELIYFDDIKSINDIKEVYYWG